jgi:glutathione synthase/RimK-type ligase-like ATP-grasp enzyme
VIVLWGTPDDGPLQAVRQALGASGAPVAFLDQRHSLQTQLHGPELTTPYGPVDLDAVTAAYLRPDDPGPLDYLAPTDAAHVHRLAATLTEWAEVTPALVVHRPSVSGENGSKPYQLAMIERLGDFAVPATLVTTSPEAAAAFVAEHGVVVSKSLGAQRSVVRRLGPDDLARFDAVRWAPTQLQAYVAGVDWRVHVVGGEVVHACRVESDADDYRFDPRTVLAEAAVPGEVGAGCVALAEGLGLLLAGVDLRVAPGGRWHCFEVNPSPAFTYFERGPHRPVTEAVARLLRAA